jgi:hypothetical protein
MEKSIKIKPIDTTYQSVKQILEEARKKAYSAVNFAMVQAYWNIGRIIVEEEQRGRAKAEYGEYLIKELSGRLTNEFGKGFDRRNLWFMRSFYLSFKIVNAVRSQSLPGKGHALRGESPFVRPELSWTHYRLLLKVERPDVLELEMKGRKQ